VKPFTASPYYDFFDAFLLGLKLETFFSGSDACLMAGVYMIDDYFYLQNNITDFQWSSWEAPIMNFTKAVAGNFSNTIVNCEIMLENIYKYSVDRFAKFNNNLADFLLSFLFNLMGRSLQFKSIFDAINDDIKNQYYVDIANQYGRMIRVIFDFDP
jgi:purine-cytosine permease-like protein